MQIVKAEIADAEFIAAHLRAADVLELSLARSGVSPLQAIKESVALSNWCKVIKVCDQPVVIYGLCPGEHASIGVPWMVATDGIAQITRQFVRGSIREAADMLSQYPYICNMVHRENKLSIRWLHWLGFHINPDPIGPSNAFNYFWKGNLNV